LLNLILNAVEAMRNEGVVELRASVTKILPSKPVLEPERSEKYGLYPSYILISVVDQGGGIPAETLPRIFEPFFTTKAFSTRRGTGLGLSMVYELAKAQGYGLAVETKLGSGSAFTIIIPVLAKAPPAEVKKRTL
jgi:signal transduction histidine kinase